ncbi:MAG: hypothetical protein JRH01_22575 [Deltaproteobacteria bacterium]|nr:hypothetical protein [Deltaproteobacteria bacterium]MBW2396632.1 hypothetical protein [Deltaproteobacteria bacterium]
MHEIGIVFAALVFVVSVAATAEESGPAASPGAASYQRHCSGCHGHDGRRMAAIPGLDLTRLAAKYGRPLAGPELLDHLGGRRPLRADWTRDTQVCGQGFMGDLAPGLVAQLMRRGTAMEILRYLDTIQADVVGETSE